MDLLLLIASYAYVIFKVAVGLGLVIFLHELGHFAAAKLCGVKCEKFYVGFDPPLKIGPIHLPRTLGKFTWGETEYGIGVIPLGGYVKMLGQDDNPANAEQEAARIRVRKSELEGGDAEMSSGDEDAEDLVLDPRSYPAKSVPQRMFIISAGVIMNLASAVVLAAIAYSLGVPITPCEIAGASAGDPAWVLGLQSGDKIIQVGRDGEPDEDLRFTWELRNKVAYSGIKDKTQPVELLIRRDGKEIWVSVLPSSRLEELTKLVSLGVYASRANRLSSAKPTYSNSPAERADPPLKGGDRVIAINGQKLDDSEPNLDGDVKTDQLDRMLSPLINEPISVTIERVTDKETNAKETLDVKVGVSPMRTVGLTMAIGPVAGVQIDSPAAAAGFKNGDIIRKIDDQPVGDPMTLPFRVGLKANEPVKFEVERREGEESKALTLEATPTEEATFSSYMQVGKRVALENIGVAFSVRNVVAEVDPNGPAAKSGIQAGDKLLKAQFLAEDEETKKLVAENYSKKFGKEIELNEDIRNWPYLMGIVQDGPPKMKLRVVYQRGSTPEEATLSSVASTEWNVAERGFNFVGFTRIHKAKDVQEAFALGRRETSEKFTDVLTVLKMLFSGRLSVDSLGGPIMIARIAGGEASKGWSSLWLFLTLLSVNLAILNFLPIPALDGGHFLFLCVELVIGKPVDEKWQGAAMMIGMLFLLGLMLFVVANDIRQLVL